jgi:hypothetical protein
VKTTNPDICNEELNHLSSLLMSFKP